MRKVVRALCYLKELCLMAFFKLFGAVCRCCSAKYRELWLVCERETMRGITVTGFTGI